MRRLFIDTKDKLSILEEAINLSGDNVSHQVLPFIGDDGTGVLKIVESLATRHNEPFIIPMGGNDLFPDRGIIITPSIQKFGKTSLIKLLTTKPIKEKEMVFEKPKSKYHK